MNIDNCKSYATEENLEKALARFDLGRARHIVVRNRDGRWTAIFTVANCDRVQMNPGAPPMFGFMVVN